MAEKCFAAVFLNKGKAMSRIGNRKLTIPTDVTLGVLDQSVTIKGKKGELIVKLPRSVAVKLGDGFVETVCGRKNSLAVFGFGKLVNQ